MAKVLPIAITNIIVASLSPNHKIEKGIHATLGKVCNPMTKSLTFSLRYSYLTIITPRTTPIISDIPNPIISLCKEDIIPKNKVLSFIRASKVRKTSFGDGKT